MDKIKAPAREGFLYHLWLDRQFDAFHLKTIDGRPLEIIEKGVRNYDSGPDFLNSLIRLDDQLHRGDIEIHPVAGDWYAHGHHRDPRYNHVILHLVTMDCPATFRTIRADGNIVPTLNLDDYLEKTAEELEIETELEAPPTPSCALAEKKDSTIRRLVEKAGFARFSIKVKRVAERRSTDSWDQIIYLSLLEALGYSKNQIPFRQLAETLPVEQIWSFIWNDPADLAQEKCEAYLYGAAGLLPFQQPGRRIALSPPVKKYAENLEAQWRTFPLKNKISTLKPGAWQFFRLRPSNFPTRRIAAAATFIIRFMTDGFLASCERMIQDLAERPKKIIKELEISYMISSHPFWSNHYSFEESRAELHGKEACLLGRERARDIVVNVLLPALAAYAEESHDLRLKNLILELYKQYPRLHDNELTRQMSQQIFGAGKRTDVISGALCQQGLLHLKKEMCRPDQCSVCLQKLE